MREIFSRHRAVLSTVGLASLSGWLVSFSGIPLAWMIGSMLATALASLINLPVEQPARVQKVVRASVGTMLGAAITIELLASIVVWWVSLLWLLCALVLMFAIGYLVLRRVSGFDRPSATLCAVPGGIAEMILLSDAAGADQARVAIVQALRIALTILILPVLIGWFNSVAIPTERTGNGIALLPMDWFWFATCILAALLAHRFIKMPAPLVLAPMIVSGVLHVTQITSFAVPDFVTIAVQVFIGINVGGRFAGVSPRALLGVLGAATMVVGVQITVAFTAAMAIAARMEWDALTLSLAYAPGGLAEMSLIALAVGADQAFIGFHHVFRVLTALMIAPLILAFTARNQ